MEFFNSAIDVLQTLVVALGAVSSTHLVKYGFAAFCRLSLSKPVPSSDTESSKPLSCKVKDIVTKVRAYRTALEIKLLHTCEINALSRDSCKTDMSFCKINSFPFFVQMIFALSYKEDTNGCKPINLYSGCVSSIRLMLLILLT